MKIIRPHKPKILTPKRAILTRRSLLRGFAASAPALILGQSALAQVGQIATWPPKNFVSGGGGGPLLAHLAQGSTDSNSFTSSAINTTGASLIVIGLAWYGPNAASLTPTDSQSNTYTAAASTKQVTTSPYLELYYKYSPSTSSSHTFTAGGVNVTYPLMFVFAFNGTTGASVDQGTNFGNAGSASSIQPNPITPLHNNEIIVSLVGVNTQPTSNGAISIDSGFTQPDASVGYNISTAGHYGGSMAYLVQTTAAAINPTWSWTPAASGLGANIGSFQ
jgi:hypothetical protein